MVQVISYVENGGLKLVLMLAKPLTCMTVVSNSIILTTMHEQNKQTQEVNISKKGHSSPKCDTILVTIKTNKCNKEAQKGIHQI